jgi:predicted dehydrogenase
MIKIGLIGTQSLHAQVFARVCNMADGEGKYQFPDTKVVAAYGVDDTPEHIRLTLEKGNIPLAVSSLEELFSHCNAFMVLQRRGGEHLKYAAEIIKRGYPVFIDKPVCCTMEDAEALCILAREHNAVICGGSALKHNSQIVALKRELEAQAFGQIKGATIHHSADMDSPYDGIFFYLPHAVEMMLELFGYDPISVNTMVLSHNNFIVCVKYAQFTVNLAINGYPPAITAVGSKKSEVVQIDDTDVFAQCMGNFISNIRQKKVTKDTSQLTRHVQVILAIKESMEKNTDVTIGA